MQYFFDLAPRIVFLWHKKLLTTTIIEPSNQIAHPCRVTFSFKLISGKHIILRQKTNNKEQKLARSVTALHVCCGWKVGRRREGRVFAFLVGQWHGNDGRYLARDQSSVSFARLLTLRGGGGRGGVRSLLSHSLSLFGGRLRQPAFSFKCHGCCNNAC
jgi:hypothetical protein